MEVKYGHSVQACENYSNIDHLLDNYYMIKKRLIEDIQKGDESFIHGLWSGKYMTSDTTCNVSMDIKNYNPCSKSNATCVSCKWLPRLISTCSEGSKETIDTKFTLEHGNRVGRSMIVRKRRAGGNGTYDEKLQKLSVAIVEKDHNIGVCGAYPDYNTSYVKYDTTSCEILLHVIMGAIIPYTPQFYGAFRCRKDVYIVEDSTTPISNMDMNSMAEDDIADLIVQLIMQLKILSKYTYSHCSPSLHRLNCSLMLDNIPEYEGVKFNSKYRLGIDVSEHSSITIGNRRIVAHNAIGYKHLGTNSNYTKQWKGSVVLYKTIPTGIDTLKQYKKSGIPIYTGSIDMYCFLLSMYVRKEFRNVIDDRFPMLWQKLIPEQDHLGTLYERIEAVDTSTDDPSHSELLILLSDIYLRCDAIDVAWNVIAESLPLT